MIPREILKKIRQIELRTNRSVTGFAPGARLCEPQHCRWSEGVENSERLFHVQAAAGRRPALRSLQPPPQFRRIPRAVPNGETTLTLIISTCVVDTSYRTTYRHTKMITI